MEMQCHKFFDFFILNNAIRVYLVNGNQFVASSLATELLTPLVRSNHTFYCIQHHNHSQAYFQKPCFRQVSTAAPPTIPFRLRAPIAVHK